MAINEKAWSGGFRRGIGDVSLGPTLVLALDNSTKQLHVCDIEDAGTDWALSADSQPSVYIHDISHPDTYYVKIYDNGTVGRMALHASTTYIEGNNADQLVLVAGNTIELQGTTYTNVAGNFQTSGNITLTTSAAKIYLRSTTEHIYANAANQLIITATNTINLVATTYVSTSGALNVGGALTMANNQYLYLRGTTEHIQANAANQLVLVATNTINLQATTAILLESDVWMSANKKICYYSTTEHIAGNAANQLVLTATNTIELVATTNVRCYQDFYSDGHLRMANLKNIYLRGTTNYISVNAADQIVVTSANTIALNSVGGVSVDKVLILASLASGTTNAGALWLDTTDNKLHFYNGSAEKTVTDS